MRRSLVRASCFRNFHPNADSQLTFRVSDAVRRRKVDGARTRGPRSDGLWDFRLWVVFAACRRCQYADGVES